MTLFDLSQDLDQISGLISSQKTERRKSEYRENKQRIKKIFRKIKTE